METIVFATLPMIALTGFGIWLRRVLIPAQAAWAAMGRLAYNVAFPALLITDLARAPLRGMRLHTPIALTIAATLLLACATLALKRFFRIENAAFTSFFQGSVRYNSYVYLAVAQPLYGARGVAVASCFIAVMIIVTNIVSVLVLDVYGSKNKTSVVRTVMETARNPVVLATAIGAACSLAHVRIPSLLDGLLRQVGDMALPLSLFIVGAGIRNVGPAMLDPLVWGSCLLKLLALPALTAVALHVAGVGGISRELALLYSAVPTAGNAYILAEQMGGDTGRMASIISLSAVLSIPTMMLVLTFAR